MSGRPSRKSAEIGLFPPFSAFFALFRRVRRAPGKSRKRRKKAFFLRYPPICLNPHLLNPHLRHSKNSCRKNGFSARKSQLEQSQSLAIFHRTLKSQCGIAEPCLRNRAISGVRDGNRNRSNRAIFGALSH